MKKGYWVVVFRAVSDESKFKAYGTLAVPFVQSFGGRFLTHPGSRLEPREKGLPLLSVVVEFDSYDIALAAYESAAYKQALAVLGDGAERDFRIVEGA